MSFADTSATGCRTLELIHVNKLLQQAPLKAVSKLCNAYSVFQEVSVIVPQ
jgi:hypothetical protein